MTTIPPGDPVPVALSPEDTLAGLVDRVTYHSPDNGYCVLRVSLRGHREPVTVVGHAASVAAGEWLTASGEWVQDRVWGRQFRARSLGLSAPTSAEGIERYLASGMIRGIGPTYASKLVQAFGEAVFDTIEQSPERLLDVEGIGPVRARRIRAAWAEQRSVRDIMVFLHSHGVGTARAVRIFKRYGAAAVEVMSADPYRLANEIHGFGFRTADAIAGKLGIAPDAMIRIRAGVRFVLTEALDEGHCGLPVARLISRVRELLDVAPQQVEAAMNGELEAGAVIAAPLAETPGVFLTPLYRAEQAIADRLLRLRQGTPPWPGIDPEKALPWMAARTGLTLAPGQAEAVRVALRSKVLVITGGPGVGKTTLVNVILGILSAKGVEILLCAPTGRAARRLSETSGREAQTIHRLLEIDPKTGNFKRNREFPLSCRLLVVDETSMVDVRLMQALLDAVPDSAALLLVGDTDQLPSVGPGQVLADVIASGAIEVLRLTEVFRQAASSRIIRNAHRINRGEMPDLDRPEGLSDFYFLPTEDADQTVRRIVELVRRHIPRRFGLDPVREIQVLCPMNRGRAGARALNAELQAALNPAGERKVERFGCTFAPGDKVMQIENDYDREVFNGDIGYIVDVDPEARELSVRFDERETSYGIGELDALAPAYAVTIHKSQGSEYPAVIIPMLTEQHVMLQRNLLYTGLTRGRRLTVLVGQPRAIAIAVRNASGNRRWTRLRGCLAGGSPSDPSVDRPG